MTRGQRGRLIGRGMIALTILGIGMMAIGFLAAPGTMGGPMYAVPPGVAGIPVDMLVPGIGAAGVLFGLAWMIRIHRADPEPDQHAWRHRRDR